MFKPSLNTHTHTQTLSFFLANTRGEKTLVTNILVVGTLNIAGNVSWRLPCYLQVVGPVFVFGMTMFCPESPRVSNTKPPGVGKENTHSHSLTPRSGSYKTIKTTRRLESLQNTMPTGSWTIHWFNTSTAKYTSRSGRKKDTSQPRTLIFSGARPTVIGF